MSDHSKNHPNIIFILSDDQGEWAMGCSGNDEIITPNLDCLAGEGFDSRIYLPACGTCY